MRTNEFGALSVFRNDWGCVEPPPIGGFTPELEVSVVIPAYGEPDKLALTLASLSRQTYPPELLEVVVVDDGSEPPLVLPEPRPARCRVVRTPAGRWGRAAALAHGAAESTGDILHWLDADMVLDTEHVEAQARWHHALPDAVVLGDIRFCPTWDATPDEVVAADDLGALFPETFDHDWVEEILAATDDLKVADHLAFRAHVGATASVRRDLYEEAGGIDPALVLGQDTELGFRLAQAGAVFVPERRSRSWHLGPTTMMRKRAAGTRYRVATLADRMPQPPRFRGQVTGRIWSVPLVVAVVEVKDHGYERVRACVDRLLSSTVEDLRVILVGDAADLRDERRRVLDDADLDLRLLQAEYRGEPRVEWSASVPHSVAPAPYRLDVPADVGVGADSVRRMIDAADRLQVGLLDLRSVRLWRTAAVARARRHHPDDALPDAVRRTHGVGELPPRRGDLVDLRARAARELRPPLRPRTADGSGPVAPSGGRAGLLRLGARRVPGLRAVVRRVRTIRRRLDTERAKAGARPGA